MYGRVLPSAIGVSLLPATGDSKPLFIVAVSLIIAGAVIAAASLVMARKSRNGQAKA